MKRTCAILPQPGDPRPSLDPALSGAGRGAGWSAAPGTRRRAPAAGPGRTGRGPGGSVLRPAPRPMAGRTAGAEDAARERRRARLSGPALAVRTHRRAPGLSGAGPAARAPTPGPSGGDG